MAAEVTVKAAELKEEFAARREAAQRLLAKDYADIQDELRAELTARKASCGGALVVVFSICFSVRPNVFSAFEKCSTASIFACHPCKYGLRPVAEVSAKRMLKLDTAPRVRNRDKLGFVVGLYGGLTYLSGCYSLMPKACFVRSCIQDFETLIMQSVQIAGGSDFCVKNGLS